MTFSIVFTMENAPQDGIKWTDFLFRKPLK